MGGERILIVEDDIAVQEMLVALFSDSGYETETAFDGPQAIELAKASAFHLYMIDLRLPSMSGIDVMKEIRTINSEAICIVLTAFGTIALSVKAIKAGAFDFVSKPFQTDVVLALVKNALEHCRLKRENFSLQRSVRGKYRFENIIGHSPLMGEVHDLIEKIIDTDSTILIQGESGTGKEVIAKTIHYNSPRKDKPFIPINCGAIPESLLESELFGHERGAFTGATSSRLGRFELAHGGTLLLDEISEMPFPLQVKLLRVLQEREFERVGGNRSIRVDVRIISATNQDLEEAVEEKRFREDLFYRLNVIPINLPPLRDRKDDILILAHHFMNQLNERKKWNILGITPEAQELLMEYPWPGNVRELENLMERVMTLKQEGVISKEELPPKFTRTDRRGFFPNLELPEEGVHFSELVSQFEDQLLQKALLKAKGVKNRAAQLLHLNRTTLVEKLKKRGMSVKGKYHEHAASST